LSQISLQGVEWPSPTGLDETIPEACCKDSMTAGKEWIKASSTDMAVRGEKGDVQNSEFLKKADVDLCPKPNMIV